MSDNESDKAEAGLPEGEPSQERRRYFRIKGDMVLLHKEVAPEEISVPTEARELPPNPFTVSSTLDLLTQESRTLLRRIERDSPEVADFLKVLERKIDVLSRAFLAYETDLAKQPVQWVSLSASGLAFDTDHSYRSGSLLELKMVLLPDLIGLLAYGKVVYCYPNRADVSQPYHVAVDFVDLAERDRELIIRHVMKQQLQQLREKKHQPE